MRYVVVLSLVCCVCNTATADDIPVKWTIDKPEGLKVNAFVAKNKLPPGATIKVRVIETTGEIGFLLDITPKFAKEAGDTFQGKVGPEGKLFIGGGVEVLPDTVDGDKLVFKSGKKKLVLEVKVSD